MTEVVETFNITPAPGFYRQMKKAFEETIAKAERQIKRANEILEGADLDVLGHDDDLICQGLELLVEDELKRIEEMRKGIAMVEPFIQEAEETGQSAIQD